MKNQSIQFKAESYGEFRRFRATFQEEILSKKATTSNNFEGHRWILDPQGSKWTDMGPNGSQWILIDPLGSLWTVIETDWFELISKIYKYPDGSLWILMDPYGYWWILMDPDGSGLRGSKMKPDGSKWISINTNGSEWIKMDPNGFRWIPMHLK